MTKFTEDQLAGALYEIAEAAGWDAATFDRFHDIAMRLQRSEHVDESDMRDLFFAVMARCSVRRSTLPPTTCSPNAMAR